MEITIIRNADTAASARARFATAPKHTAVARRICAVATGLCTENTHSSTGVGSNLVQGVRAAFQDMGVSTNRTFPNRSGPPTDRPPV